MLLFKKLIQRAFKILFALANFIFIIFTVNSYLFLLLTVISLPLIGNIYRIGILRIPEFFAFLFILANFLRSFIKYDSKLTKTSIFFSLFVFGLFSSFLVSLFNVDYPQYINVWASGAYAPVRYNLLMFLRLVLCFAFFRSVVSFLKTNPIKLDKLLKTHIIIGSIVSIYGITQFILFVIFRLNIGIHFEPWSLSPQILGTANEPGPFAGYLLTTLLPAVIAYHEKILFPRMMLIWLILFQILAMFLTFSSAGWIITISVLFLYFLRYNKKILIRYIILFVPLLIIISFFYFNHENQNILVSLSNVFVKAGNVAFADPSTAFEGGRLSGRYLSLNMFRSNPFLGIGFGNFPFLRNEFLNPQNIPFINGGVDLPNNVYFEILAEGGIISFAFFSLMIFNILLILLIKRKYLQGSDQKKYRILFYPILGVMMNLFFSSLLNILYVWFLPAVLLAVLSKDKKILHESVGNSKLKGGN